jgi:hypothetical protein
MNRRAQISCSWIDLVRLAGWEFARSDSNRTLAFVYAARISLSVEEWCAKVNPDLSLGDLGGALTKKPDFLAYRKGKEWLKTEWPQHKATTTHQLEVFGLTAAKALLAVGSRIADGTADEMIKAMELMFPQIIAKRQRDENTYEAWNANVIVDTGGDMNWGYGGPLARTGRSLPGKNTNIGDRSAFELFLQNQMRISIQQRIEAIS